MAAAAPQMVVSERLSQERSPEQQHVEVEPEIGVVARFEQEMAAAGRQGHGGEVAPWPLRSWRTVSGMEPPASGAVA